MDYLYIEEDCTRYFDKAILNTSARGQGFPRFEESWKSGLDSFTLIILEKVDINNLTIEEIKEKILSREQYYIDLYNPEYNIAKVASSP